MRFFSPVRRQAHHWADGNTHTPPPQLQKFRAMLLRNGRAIATKVGSAAPLRQASTHVPRAAAAASFDGQNRSTWGSAAFLAATGVVAGAAAAAFALNGSPAQCAGDKTYTLKEVAKRDGGADSGGRTWVTRGDGVYDITEFIASHPGGECAGLFASAAVLWHYRAAMTRLGPHHPCGAVVGDHDLAAQF